MCVCVSSHAHITKAVAGLKLSIANDSKMSGKVTNTDMQTIFSCVEQVYSVHADLYQKWEGSGSGSGDVIQAMLEQLEGCWDKVSCADLM